MLGIVLALAALLVLFVAKPGYVLKLGLVLVLLCVIPLGAFIVLGAAFGPIIWHPTIPLWGVASLASIGALRALLK